MDPVLYFCEVNGPFVPREICMSNPIIVVHYHELWLKGRNRRFFLRKLSTALRLSLQGIPVDHGLDDVRRVALEDLPKTINCRQGAKSLQ